MNVTHHSTPTVQTTALVDASANEQSQSQMRLAEPKPDRRKQKHAGSPADDVLKWKRHFDSLSPEARHIIESETAAIREDLMHGSKLRIGQRFARVRKALAPVRGANAATKKLWSLYLKVHPFPGISRATGYRVMDACEAAEMIFHPAFLDAFAASGLALNVSPSNSAPLGKYTDVAKSFPQLRPDAELGQDAASELVHQVAAEFAKSKAKPQKKTRREQEQRLHELVLTTVKRVVDGFMEGDASAADYRDELDVVVARLYGAMGITEDVTIEPKFVSEFARLDGRVVGASDDPDDEGETSDEESIQQVEEASYAK